MSPLLALTVSVLGWQHSLQGGTRATPPLILQVIAASFGRPILVGVAVGRSRTRVGNDGVQNAEGRQGEAALIRAQLEPEHKHLVSSAFNISTNTKYTIVLCGCETWCLPVSQGQDIKKNMWTWKKANEPRLVKRM